MEIESAGGLGLSYYKIKEKGVFGDAGVTPASMLLPQHQHDEPEMGELGVAETEVLESG